MIILNLVILILLILFLRDLNENFYVDCNELSVKLNPENSYRSFSKGWCTNSNFNDNDAFNSIDYSENTNNYSCLNGLKPLTGNESSQTDSKSFCVRK